MKRAVFLDRDGVLNELVLNRATGDFEPPHFPEDLVIFPWVPVSLRSLQEAGFLIFLVSNQPDYAKGKTSLEQIHVVHSEFDRYLTSTGILFQDYYYCYHHPQGVVPEYSIACQCRKPKPYFLLEAARRYDINLKNSWMIGDRDSDIDCGVSAGTHTILVENPHSSGSRGSSSPEFRSANLKDAVAIILHH